MPERFYFRKLPVRTISGEPGDALEHLEDVTMSLFLDPARSTYATVYDDVAGTILKSQPLVQEAVSNSFDGYLTPGLTYYWRIGDTDEGEFFAAGDHFPDTVVFGEDEYPVVSDNANVGLVMNDRHLVVSPSPWLQNLQLNNIYPESSRYNGIPVVAGFMAEGRYYTGLGDLAAGAVGAGTFIHANCYVLMVSDPPEFRLRAAGAYPNEFPYGGPTGSGYELDGVTPCLPKRMRGGRTVGFLSFDVWNGLEYAGSVARIGSQLQEDAGTPDEIASTDLYFYAPDNRYDLHDVPPYGKYEPFGGGYRHTTTLVMAPAGSVVYPTPVASTSITQTANAASNIAGTGTDWVATTTMNADIASSNDSRITAATGATDGLLVTFPAFAVPAGMIITHVQYTVEGQQTGAMTGRWTLNPYKDGAEVTGIQLTPFTLGNGTDTTVLSQSPQDNVFQTSWVPDDFATPGQFGCVIRALAGATNYRVDTVTLSVTYQPYLLRPFGLCGDMMFSVNFPGVYGNGFEVARFHGKGRGALVLGETAVDWYYGRLVVQGDVRVTDAGKVYLDSGHQEVVSPNYVWAPASNTAALNGGIARLDANNAGAPLTVVAATASGGNRQLGLYGVTPVSRQTLPAAATDPATTMALTNAIRTALITLGAMS